MIRRLVHVERVPRLEGLVAGGAVVGHSLGHVVELDVVEGVGGPGNVVADMAHPHSLPDARHLGPNFIFKFYNNIETIEFSLKHMFL